LRTGFFAQPDRDGEQMEALLTAIVLWLSINFPLPANLNHPGIKFVSAAEMITVRTDVSASEISSDIVALYSNESKTIYLMDGWTGKTPAELSILVHEMVHHLQNVGQLKFVCQKNAKNWRIRHRIAGYIYSSAIWSANFRWTLSQSL
jgi:hypothetical protein